MTINLTAKDGYDISAYCWDKVENPRVVLQIFHVMAEYAGRYDRLAKCKRFKVCVNLLIDVSINTSIRRFFMAKRNE